MDALKNDQWKTIAGVCICLVIAWQMISRWNDSEESAAPEESSPPTEQVQAVSEEAMKTENDSEDTDVASEMIERQKTEAERTAAKEEAQKVAEMIPETTNGIIMQIAPMLGDDWGALYATVSNEWYLMSDEEKEYFVQELGPTLSEAIEKTGVTDYSEVHFIDENSNIVASPKFSGGYELQ